MSHYVVAVICDSPNDVQSLLDPYYENTENEKYLTFNDVEDKSRKEWETEGANEWYPEISHRLRNGNAEEEIRKIKKDGKYEFIFDNPMEMSKLGPGIKIRIDGFVNAQENGRPKDLKNSKKDYCYVYGIVDSYKLLTIEEIISHIGFKGMLNIRKLCDDRDEFFERLNSIKICKVVISVCKGPKKVKHKVTYSTFKKFMEEWHEYKIDEKTGKYGYWSNPNAKWDWFQIGGRWRGFLLIKDGEEGEVGAPGVFKNKVPTTPNGYKRVDVCKLVDVQWDKMEQIQKFEVLKNENEDGDVWGILTNDNHPKRDKYSFYNASYYIDRYGNKENYIRASITFSTYAVLTPDGKWHAPGDMGWFGCSDETHEDKRKFVNNFKVNFIDPYQDKFIAIVDCHI